MYVKRTLEQKLSLVRGEYGLIALVGARQSGKTTLLKECMMDENASYILFDDPDPREIFDRDIKEFQLQYLSGKKLTVLDEVHNCSGAGQKLKYLADTGHKLWITSSSELLLSRDVLSYLVGRAAILRLFPFSYEEFLRAKEQKVTTKAISRRMVWEHLTYGGYPRVALSENVELKETILRNLYETITLKDIARSFSISDIASLERFARYLAVNVGNPLMYDTVSKTVGISFPTIKKYLDAMEKSYLIVRVKPFFTNKNKELVKQPRIYFLDTGIRNMVARNFSRDPDGKVFENYVLTELLKMGLEVKYWRTLAKTEVDFVVEKGKDVMPIEVKLRSDTSRIGRGFRSFIDTYSPKEAYYVSFEGDEGEKEVNGCHVKFVNVSNLYKQTSLGA